MTKYTKRGVQLLERVANGDSIERAADHTFIARSTADKHLAKIKKQLNAKTLYHAVHIATKSGLIMVIFVASVNNGGVDFERRRVSARRREQYDFLLIPTII